MNDKTLQGQKRALQRKVVLTTILFSVYVLGYVLLCHYMQTVKNNPRIESVDMQKELLHSLLSDPAGPLMQNTSLLMFYMLGGMFAVLAFLGRKRPKTEHLEDNHFMTISELKQYKKDKTEPFDKTKSDINKGLIYSKDIQLSYDNKHTNLNMNALICAGSGKGKSFFFVSPNLLHLFVNAVVTDPSGELLARHGKHLENMGYKVRCINTGNPYKGLRYNPLYYINSEQDVLICIDTFIKNTKGKGERCTEEFWINCERLLLYAVVLYLYHNYSVSERTFTNVLKMIKLAKVDENDPDQKSALDILFDDLEKRDPDNTAVKYYKDFKIGAGKTLKSILISVESRTAKLELGSMQYLTDVDEMELDSFADQKNVLFINVPTGDTSFNFIISMLYSQLFMLMYNYAENTARFGYSIVTKSGGAVKTFRASNDEESAVAKKKARAYIKEIKEGLTLRYNKKRDYVEVRTKKRVIGWRGTKEEALIFAKEMEEAVIRKCEGGRCPIHVQLFLDEFANIGEIPDFIQKLSTIRKYAIGCSIILQSISQLEKDYKDDVQSIQGCCDVKLFLGNTDDKSVEWIKTLLGKREIVVASESVQSGGGGSVSYSPHSVDMLPDYKIRQLNYNYCITMVSGYYPTFGLKYQTKKDPVWNECKRLENKFKVDERKAEYYTNKDIPLYLREQQEAVSVQEHGISKDEEMVRRTRNAVRKEDAKEAEKDLAEFDKEDSKKTEAMIIEGIADALGVSPGMTDKQIKEHVDSIIALMDAPEEIKFRATK